MLSFSSKSTFFSKKNFCDGHISFPPKKNFGPFHHKKQLFSLPMKHSLIQISAGFKDVGTKPQFSTLSFSCIASTLFYASAKSIKTQSANPPNNFFLQKPLSPLPTSQIPSIYSATNKPLTLTAELTILSLEQVYIYLSTT